MRRLLCLFLVTFALKQCSTAQTIQPAQIAPATQNNQVLTTVTAGLPPVWQAPSSGGITQLTGDATAGPGTGSVALTLTTVNSNVGSFTNANITVDAKGRITSAASGSSTGGVASIIPGTNVTCSTEISGSCTGAVTINASGGITELTVGTTPVASGTTGNVLYNNSGTLGNLSPIITINSTPCQLGSSCTISGGGSGTITGVTAGTNLSGGGTSGTVTLNLIASPSVTSLLATGSGTITTAGGYIEYNLASSGETDMVGNRGSGAGGLNIYNATSGGTLGTPIVTIDGSGNATFTGIVTAAGSGSPGVTLAPTATAISGTNYGSVPLTIQSSFYNSGAFTAQWGVAAQLGTGSTPSPSLVFSGPAALPLNETIVLQLDPSILATSSVNYNGPALEWVSPYWNGTASANDTWFLTPTQGVGANAYSILSFTHSGTSGFAEVQVPLLKILGLSTGCMYLNGSNQVTSTGSTCGSTSSTNTGYTIGSGRALGSVYQNTGATARYVSVTLTGTSGFLNAYTSSSSFTPPSGSVAASWNSGGSGGTIGIWVLPNFYYSFYTTGSITATEWWEFQL